MPRPVRVLVSANHRWTIVKNAGAGTGACRRGLAAAMASKCKKMHRLRQNLTLFGHAGRPCPKQLPRLAEHGLLIWRYAEGRKSMQWWAAASGGRMSQSVAFCAAEGRFRTRNPSAIKPARSIRHAGADRAAEAPGGGVSMAAQRRVIARRVSMKDNGEKPAT